MFIAINTSVGYSISSERDSSSGRTRKLGQTVQELAARTRQDAAKCDLTSIKSSPYPAQIWGGVV